VPRIVLGNRSWEIQNGRRGSLDVWYSRYGDEDRGKLAISMERHLQMVFKDLVRTLTQRLD